jgi:hypothetical protein
MGILTRNGTGSSHAKPFGAAGDGQDRIFSTISTIFS